MPGATECLASRHSPTPLVIKASCRALRLMMEAHERSRSAEQLQRQGHQGRPVGKIPRAQLLLRSQPCELCDRDGSLIPFARTKTERDAAGDPHPDPGRDEEPRSHRGNPAKNVLKDRMTSVLKV